MPESGSRLPLTELLLVTQEEKGTKVGSGETYLIGDDYDFDYEPDPATLHYEEEAWESELIWFRGA